jgi:hypothetical protein
MAKRKKVSPPPNPNGRDGTPLKVPLPFDDALKAALETPPPKTDKKKRALDRKPAKR